MGNRYQVTLMVDDGWNPQQYREYEADTDEEALEIGISKANEYIRSGKRPRLTSAHVSKLHKSGRDCSWRSIDTEYRGHLQRGRELLREEVTACYMCGGTGRILPRK